ncbi:PREDICTED: transmembrane protein C5orf28 [Ceratosolen solmsi marchali]|uniref:Transmembrane protein 267 n=1 Tax=Ceratosolen solmsi marchali TaxID=326594 RepID=A0AAJ6YB86_9HYME|nr:PREDICTED: transmembrane protein C5orf28 [Ceratosolen solmsi marchali]
MLSFKQAFIQRAFLTGLIGIVSVLGDKGLQNGKSEIVRAISDNLTHAIVGGITWTLVLVLSKQSLTENLRRIITCFFMSSLIDVDHFITAQSWDINDATHINHRPFLHCTTIPVLIWIIMYLIYKLFNIPILITYSWMILASFISHHLRDGNRRGLWFWPFGSTQPIPYYLYLSLCMVFPYFIYWIMNWQLTKHTEELLLII